MSYTPKFLPKIALKHNTELAIIVTCEIILNNLTCEIIIFLSGRWFDKTLYFMNNEFYNYPLLEVDVGLGLLKQYFKYEGLERILSSEKEEIART